MAEGKPSLPECAWPDCKELVDGTPGLGMDSSCPYHRLLFDHWLYEVSNAEILALPRDERNKFVSAWVEKVGKDKCDSIVDEMSRDGINWKC